MIKDDKTHKELRNWLRKRFEALGDISEFLAVASPEYKDQKVYFDKLIQNEPDLGLAEKRLSTLEKVIHSERKTTLDINRIELQKLRIIRDQYLRDTDWTQSVSDCPLDRNVKKEYRLYRKYLRELPLLIERQQVIGYVVLEFDKWLKNKPIFEGSEVI